MIRDGFDFLSTGHGIDNFLNENGRFRADDVETEDLFCLFIHNRLGETLFFQHGVTHHHIGIVGAAHEKVVIF